VQRDGLQQRGEYFTQIDMCCSTLFFFLAASSVLVSSLLLSLLSSLLSSLPLFSLCLSMLLFPFLVLSGDSSLAERYSLIFGWFLPIGGILSIPLVGYLLDRKGTHTHIDITYTAKKETKAAAAHMHTH
jgi:hypothetical protein